MAIGTVFTERFQVTHPLVLAPMGGVSGGLLAAAVSNAGGLGPVGGGYGDPRWLQRELGTVVGSASKPWGVGLITWAVREDTVRLPLTFTDTRDGHEAELGASADARDRFAGGHQAGNPDVGLVWAGEGIDLISAVESAANLVSQIIAQAEGLLGGASRLAP